MDAPKEKARRFPVGLFSCVVEPGGITTPPIQPSNLLFRKGYSGRPHRDPVSHLGYLIVPEPGPHELLDSDAGSIPWCVVRRLGSADTSAAQCIRHVTPLLQNREHLRPFDAVPMIEFVLAVNLTWVDPSNGQMRSRPLEDRFKSHMDCTTALTDAIERTRVVYGVAPIPLGVKLCTAEEAESSGRDTETASRLDNSATGRGNGRSPAPAKLAEISKLRIRALSMRRQAIALEDRADELERKLNR